VAWTNSLKEKIEARTARVGVIGLGYVGLSLAVELARAGMAVRGIDLDLERVSLLNRGESYLVDVPADALAPLPTAPTAEEMPPGTPAEPAGMATEPTPFPPQMCGLSGS